MKYVGYQEKWHGKIQKNRQKTNHSINEIIIEKIFQKLNVEKGNFVEFGAWDGIQNSNTRYLFLKGWKGLFIESDQNRFNHLKENYKNKKNIFLSNTHIDNKRNLIDYEIEKTLNEKIDFMSIDIDGLDVDIFETVQKFPPTVLCIEGGQILEPYYQLVGPEISKQNIQQSLYQMELKFMKKGYKLLCAYQDAFFILNEKYKELQNYQKDTFNHYLDGLLAYPRIPYIKNILDEVNIKNRIIDFIIKPLDKYKIFKIAKFGSVHEKMAWVDTHFPMIESRVNDLKKLRLDFPYDEHNEALFEKISKN